MCRGFGAVIFGDVFAGEAIGLVYNLAMGIGVDAEGARVNAFWYTQFIHQFENVARPLNVDSFAIPLVSRSDLVPTGDVEYSVCALPAHAHGLFVGHIARERNYPEVLQYFCFFRVSHHCMDLMSCLP